MSDNTWNPWKLTAIGMELPNPVRQSVQECEFRGIVFPTVGHIHRSDDQITQLRLYDPGLHVECGMTEDGIRLNQIPTDV